LKLVNFDSGDHGFPRQMSESPPSTPPKQRLKFIDLARSIAILLMLEGHFVGLTLSEASRDTAHPVYMVWNFIRGFTAPLFFTVAGMIFVFLLTGEKEAVFLKSQRVRKGLRRALELFFWGYILQINVANIPTYLQGNFESWIFAFHVLQCIGVGLITLILISGLRKAVGKFRLEAWYVAALVICMAVYSYLKGLPEAAYVPAGWHDLFQNAIRGPRSVFPIAPWLGFAFLGGAMGAYLRSIEHRPITWKSCLWFFYIALGLQLIFLITIALPLPSAASSGIQWFTQRACQVAIFLGILRLVEIRWGIGVEWLLRVGRETFAIYIVHVIVLYGGIFGIGLNDWFSKSLNPWQAALGAALFLSVFTAHGQLLNLWKTRKRVHK
jgi:uncharacterized membrane protein